jgi:1-aminocyclopropane-1-carboxylate deaminase
MADNEFKTPSPLQEVSYDELNRRNIELFIKRDDLIHQDVSGNKWRKLKLNIAQAQQKRHDTLLTFGGAHSNHIAATAAAAKISGLKSIGIIRGEDADLSNPTLKLAAEKGMKLHRISREEFREADNWEYIASLKAEFGNFYHIPKGGANYYGVQGCQDIIDELPDDIDRIFVACGTATTVSGMAIANKGIAELYAVSVLKGGGFLLKAIEKNLHTVFKDDETEFSIREKVHLLLAYHFGGYAKTSDELIHFMRHFHSQTGIKLDPVYTGKTAFAMTSLARKLQYSKPEKWVLIHSGGMQGIEAMESKLGESIYP